MQLVTVLDGTLTRLRLVFCFAIFCFPSPPSWKRQTSRWRIHFYASRCARYGYVCCTFPGYCGYLNENWFAVAKAPKVAAPFSGVLHFLLWLLFMGVAEPEEGCFMSIRMYV